MSEAGASHEFFPYRFGMRYAPLWAPLTAWPGRDGVTLTDESFRATFGVLKLETTRDNVIGGHVTEGYRWYKAIGARLSRVDDGLTFGTNADRGVCVHFRHPVPRVIGSSLTRRSPSLSRTAPASCGQSVRPPHRPPPAMPDRTPDEPLRLGRIATALRTLAEPLFLSPPDLRAPRPR